jgi:hypothetical protein
VALARRDHDGSAGAHGGIIVDRVPRRAATVVAGKPLIMRAAIIPLLVVLAVAAVVAAADARWLLAAIMAAMFAAFLRLYVLAKPPR